MIVYCLSGIGADYRLFTRLQLPAGFQICHIPWIKPNPRESLPEYAVRLFTPYNSTKPFGLIGLSLGGIMASEITRSFAPRFTIIISSVPIASQLPPYYRVARKLRLYKVFPPILWKITALCKHSLTMNSKNDRRLVWQVIKDGDSSFIKWGIRAVLEWENETIPRPLYHVHGTRDEVFPIRFTNPNHIIAKAGHSLVLTHANKLNIELDRVLQSVLSDPS
jgi:pimeloyl-ACP methyl ester carboxylesterase